MEAPSYQTAVLYWRDLQLTAAAWVKSLNTRDDGDGKHTYSLLWFDLSTGHLLAVSLVKSERQIYAQL